MVGDDGRCKVGDGGRCMVGDGGRCKVGDGGRCMVGPRNAVAGCVERGIMATSWPGRDDNILGVRDLASDESVQY